MPGRMTWRPPRPLATLARRLEAYRNNPHRRRRLPERLWRAAAVLAQQHGLCRVQTVLRLNYHDLKERVAELEAGEPEERGQSKRSARPAFVEVQMPPLSTLPYAAVLELEDGKGRKLTLRLATEDSTKLADAVSALWGGCL